MSGQNGLSKPSSERSGRPQPVRKFYEWFLKQLGMVSEPERPTEPPWWTYRDEEAALRYCQSEIDSYGNVSNKNLVRWRRNQIITIIFGAIATITAGVDLGPYSHLGWLRGIPAAISTMAASFLTGFNYRSDALRQGGTVDALRGELARYRSGATPYTGQNKVSVFMANVREIIETEQRNRRMQYTSEKPEDQGDQGATGEIPSNRSNADRHAS
jgi:hypothetical protein